MPLLPQEPCLFPANLFDGPAYPTDSSSRWWALHTKPRAEKSLARHLYSRKHAFFLPIEQGKFLQRGQECRLLIEVQLLQRGVSVEIENWMVHSLEHQPPLVLTAQGQSQPYGQFS